MAMLIVLAETSKSAKTTTEQIEPMRTLMLAHIEMKPI